MNIANVLDGIAGQLVGHGFTPLYDDKALATMARAYANSTDPLRLLAAWLRRNPEAYALLSDLLNSGVPDTAVKFEMEKAPTVPLYHSDFTGPLEVLPVRRVSPFDLKRQLDQDLQAKGVDTEKLDRLDQEPIRTADGNSSFIIMDGAGQQRFHAQIVNVAGTVLYCHAGNDYWNASILHVHPDYRAKVLAAVKQHPRYTEDTNFDPWHGTPDPWASVAEPEPVIAKNEYTPVSLASTVPDWLDKKVALGDGLTDPMKAALVQATDVAAPPKPGYLARPCPKCGKLLLVRSGNQCRCDGCQHTEEIKAW